MRVKPYSTLRIAYTDSLTLEPETEAAPDRAALLQGDGVADEHKVEGGALKLPRIYAPNTVRINWYQGEDLLFTTFLVVVTRHYFDIGQLKAMDEMDDFSHKTEEEFWAARQSATEIFERNARRSFVQQMGSHKAPRRTAKAVRLFVSRFSSLEVSNPLRANMSSTLSRAKKGQTRCFFRVWPFLCALVRVATWLDQAVLTTPLSAPTHEKKSNGTEQGLTMSCSYRLSPISLKIIPHHCRLPRTRNVR